MTSEQLKKARDYEGEYMHFADSERPAFHLTGPIGWINDPNGFSTYKGEYHLFFQYHPYDTHWGPMHWGHAKTRDFIRWEYLPAALAPDTEADRDGCFSGSAVEMPDGRQLLLYTGIHKCQRPDGAVDMVQNQCVAVGDGLNFEKYENNPVLDISDLPEGYSDVDFRDPKLWREGEHYYTVLSSRAPDGSGSILLYQSEDGFHWNYVCVLEQCKNQYGRMWECPDFFPLGENHLLLTSPMAMENEGLEFHSGYGTLALIGRYDPHAHRFEREGVQAIDYGLDFYATQTMETPDGRRVMVAWMQNWATVQNQKDNIRLYGCMTIPRELGLRNGRLIQNPVRELESYRGERTAYEEVELSGSCGLKGIRGRRMDLTVTVRPVNENLYHRFSVSVARGERGGADIRYDPVNGVLHIDRTGCGGRFDIVHERRFSVRKGGTIKLRVIVDRDCVELFVNDGEQAASFLLYDEHPGEGVQFEVGGQAVMDVEQYELIAP